MWAKIAQFRIGSLSSVSLQGAGLPSRANPSSAPRGVGRADSAAPRRADARTRRGCMTRVTHFDLAIIGSGSGNSIADGRFADRKTAILEKGVFGGTCLNVGCIPTKMFVHPADLAASVEHARV